ncbi:hypothetical protein OIU77_029572 [Salix suchowensis]|uniref:Uncharacterized protein n=1 Tax=Salix suchowensis TaxID=1278906 RepID=A0ABQ9BBW9_9ROSI|nr:hypothetical protein OIU77_029572 [Salix suchowensis]
MIFFFVFEALFLMKSIEFNQPGNNLCLFGGQASSAIFINNRRTQDLFPSCYKQIYHSLCELRQGLTFN